MLKELNCEPSVFAVGKRYIIAVSAACEALVHVKVGDKNYYDDSNGIMHSKKYIHMIEVHQDALDKEKEYTIYIREIIERKPYFPTSKDVSEYTIKFRPVEKDAENINIYHISDTHGGMEYPCKCAEVFGKKIDVLILNGDIADHSGAVENFNNLFMIAGNVTHGEIPCVFSRGNHDLRGQCAEILHDYTPTDNGKSFYTFRLGSIWGIVLDCGEDKGDWHDEYGHTVVCHDFRIRETEFLKGVIENCKNEYEEEGVKYKLLVSHVPFAERFEKPFNPEEEIYTEWCKLLKDNVKPDLWLSGHKHVMEINRVGGNADNFGQPCDVIVAAKPKYDEDWKMNDFEAGGVIIEKDRYTVIFNNSKEIFRNEEL